jgi:hypothetical protein
MTANAHQHTLDEARAPAIRPILFTLGLVRDWGLYMPHLLRVARKHGAGIHVLETGAPAGTGTFTASTINNTPADLVGKPSSINDDPYPAQPEPDGRLTSSGLSDPKNLNLAWPDVVASTAQMNEFVSALVDYSHRIGARVIAIPKGGFLSSLFQGFQAGQLEEQGFEVVLLEEISQTDLDKLKAANELIAEQNRAEVS